MLVTFVLFGHWMEMKSRRGTSDALRALFDLAPPMAHVVRDGSERDVPTAEVKVGKELVERLRQMSDRAKGGPIAKRNGATA